MGSNGDGAALLRPTVLVCENEALIAMLIEQTLDDAGYHTLWSKDGRSGPDGVQEIAGLAAAVMNLRLDGGLDGRDVIRRLRARLPALPVVVVTGHPLDAPEADLRGLGGPTLRLSKPVDTVHLVGWLAAALKPGQRPPDRFFRRSLEGLVQRGPEGP